MQSDRTVELTGTQLGDEYRTRIRDGGVSPADLTRAAVADERLAVAYRDRFLPTPVFLGRGERKDVAWSLDTTYKLLLDLPSRRFGGDVTALAAAVGMNDVQRRVLEAAVPTGASTPRLPAVARADLYRDLEGFRLLELNVTSALGGFENADINRAMLQHPLLDSFAADRELSYVDTLACIVRSMEEQCDLPPGRPCVGLVDWPESYKTYAPRLRLLASLLRPMGFDALPCHVGELRQSGGALVLGERRLDIVFRFFLIEEIETEADLELVRPILDCSARGSVSVFSRLDAELYGNKGSLALLSEELPQTGDPARDFLPWTRFVRRSSSDLDGKHIDLLKWATERREELLLKPTLLHGGRGISCGWTASPEAWAQQLREVEGGAYVLQQRVRPRPELFPSADPSDDPLSIFLNWGVFLFSNSALAIDGFGGCIVRGVADPHVGVISMGTGAQVGCCLVR